MFVHNSFQASPPGLIRLLRGFVLKDNETPEEGRRRFFRRVFGILWVSSFWDLKYFFETLLQIPGNLIVPTFPLFIVRACFPLRSSTWRVLCSFIWMISFRTALFNVIEPNHCSRRNMFGYRTTVTSRLSVRFLYLSQFFPCLMCCRNLSILTYVPFLMWLLL